MVEIPKSENQVGLAARPSKARANTIKYNNEIQQPLTVLHAERADNPERKERHDEHVQVSRVRVVPQTPTVVRPKVNHDRST